MQERSIAASRACTTELGLGEQSSRRFVNEESSDIGEGTVIDRIGKRRPSMGFVWPLLDAFHKSGGRTRPMRSRLIRIVFIPAAPALVGLILLTIGLYHSEREQLSQSMFASATTLASALDRDLVGIISAAQVLASSPSLAADDLAGFNREAKAILPRLNGYGLVLTDATGRQIVDTMNPIGDASTEHADLASRKKVFETGEPSISDLFIGPITKSPALSVDVPVFRDNQVRYALGVAVAPARLDDLLHRLALPRGWAATVIDSSDVIVANSRDPAVIGRLPPARPPTADQSQRGLIETYRPDGSLVFVGFSKSAISGWHVAISVPVDEFSRRPNAILLIGGIGMLGILLVGLMLAAYESARIERAVGNLIIPALALGRGDTPRASVSGISEVDNVAQALDQAHQLLQQRTDERDSAKLSIAERSLADEMFRLAVEACPNGMVMIGGDGNIMMVNSEIEHQFGYSRGELIGLSAEVLVPEPLHAQHVLHPSNSVRQKGSRPIEDGCDLLGIRKDGTEFPIEVRLNPIQDGAHLLVLAVIVDISDSKRMERLKDEFVATVSHELRTPLTSIAGSLGLLVGQWSDSLPESATRLVSIAHKNIQRLVRLINDILDIEKLESGRVIFNLSRVGIGQVAAQAIEDNRGFAREYGVQIRLGARSADAEVNADPDRLTQVITNLLSNAIKFSPKGSEVVVNVEKRGDVHRVSVRDHGSGIPDEFRLDIFEKFAQADGTNSRSKGGSGLGLSIVKQIVERLGGHVGFDDAPGGGTVFYVDLPAWDGSGDESDVEVEASPPRLLVCDDDPAAAKAIRARLRRVGFMVDFAHTPETAILRTAATRYAVILIDLKLRDADGIDLIVQMRAQPSHSVTPIVVISGDPDRGRSDARAAGLNISEWFQKPIDFGRLTRTLLVAASPTAHAVANSSFR
ncbi:ATP-binding protein [Bradyrhizobium ontarionense]|uniref:histidine kinase n=1 Tax=Bradyrhizobium ontarionense TaxID=2898149 RepID=A0ABY3RN93_9BRAD|nr:ATP-binding protein [Bradyrhizobium sp. A19]UFZ07979.1 ATP-binding protein [Bradyrhizobium sp. A19]